MAKTRVLHFSGNGGSFELAVNPKEISVTQTSGNKSINLLNVGEVVIAGYRGPIKVSIATFLPSPSSHFFAGNAPGDTIQLIKKWKNGKQPVRLIISGTDINTMFLVESADETYKEGQLDIDISWGLVEYRVLNVPAAATNAFSSNINTETLKERAGRLAVPKTVTVKAGDSLWAYAVKYYGEGALWSKIAAANGITNPDRLQIGMVVSIPEL